MAPAELTVAVLLLWSLPDPEREALLAACTRAFAQGTCAIASENDDAPVFVEARQVREGEISLEVVRTLGGEDRARRVLEFGEADSELERAKAVGLTAGVLAGELLYRREQETPSESEPSAEAPRSVLRAHSSRCPPDTFVAAQLGVGWERGLRVAEPGVAARAGWRSGASWVGIALEESWLRPAGDELRVHKGHGALWVGVSRALGSVELSGALDLGLQWLRVHTSAPLASDRGERVIPMIRLNGTATYWSGDWGLTFTARVSWLASSTSLYVQDEVVAETSRLGLAALVGPAFRWRTFGE